MAITTTMRTQISQLYVSLFGRAPDALGLGYWVGQLDAGKSIQAVAQDMFSVDAAREYFKAGSTNAEIVSQFYVNVLGRPGDADGLAYWTAKANTPGVTKGALIVDMINAVTSYAGTDAAALNSKALFNNKVAVAEYFAFDLGSNDVNASKLIIGSVDASAGSVAAVKTDFAPTAATTVTLGTGVDNAFGTAGADQFNARIINNSNSLQSGDKITGGAGNDRLDADVGNSQAFSITPETTGVETIAIRAQAVGVDTNNNNMTDPSSYGNHSQIDAQRMTGVTQWESNNSRADVVIEDVRIAGGLPTKSVTIAMVETDPGNVDFGVYFDQYSLRATSSSTSQLFLEVLDTRSAAAGTGKLTFNPYDEFRFTLRGETVVLQSQAINDAQTYDALAVAFNAAIAANPKTAGRITATVGDLFTARDTASGAAVTGNKIVLTSTQGDPLTDLGAVFFASGGVPGSSGLHTNIGTVSTNSTEKVTSKIILDDVGRGSTGGDLVVGGLSVGDTSTSRGVERFEIEVRDNSKLQVISSTNNTLQEVTVKNGVTSSTSFAYVTTTKDSGDLTVRGAASVNGVELGVAAAAAASTGENAALPGSIGQHGAYGFSDVRLIDASAMTGKFSFDAQITNASIAKYMNLVDTQPAPAPDTNNSLGAIANFVYTGGANNDTMTVDIDNGVAASRSTIVAGREDFTFSIDGGAGNDAITVRVVDAALTGGAQNWYNNQDLNNNVSISGGAGNDTIRKLGAGDTVIDAGSGDDVVYADNTGVLTLVRDGATSPAVTIAPGMSASGRAIFTFNTNDQVSLDATVGAIGSRNINDLRSDTNESYNLYNSTLVVRFKGLPSVTVPVASTGFKTSDLQVNQAIKNAINTDPTLKSLLVARDGPANSLIVESLIDGALARTDLSVTLSIPAVATLSATDITAAGLVYLPAGTVATEANVLAAMTAAKTSFDNINGAGFGDYTTQLANDGVITATGAASVTSSDNLISAGTGNDVIVLGTTVGLTTGASSNDTLKYDAAFGNDVVVNFAATGFGADHFDFVALGGTTFGVANYTTDKSINVEVIDVALATTKAAIEAKFAGANTVAQKHVFVAVSAENIGTVYTIDDAIGATNAVATVAGTIDLADTAWTSLTATSFVNSSATTGAFGAPYFLQDGPAATSSGVTPAPTPTPTPTPTPGGTTAVVLPVGQSVGASTTVTGTAAAEQFTFDAVAARLSAPNTQDIQNSFTVANDTMQFKLSTASAATTLAALNGTNGVSVQSNAITNNTLVNFGPDANGDIVTITLSGIIDPATVNISVIV